MYKAQSLSVSQSQPKSYSPLHEKMIQNTSFQDHAPRKNAPRYALNNPDPTPLMHPLPPAARPSFCPLHSKTSHHFYSKFHLLHRTLQSISASKMNFPSLYFSLCSNALSYFHPTFSPHCRHAMSRTRCRPVVMFRSQASPSTTLTTMLNRYALPCWPRKFCCNQGRLVTF